MVLLLVLATFAGADVVQTYQQRTTFEELPEKTAAPWTRVGQGHRMIVPEEAALFLNDNDAGARIAYQSMVGQIEASHRVRVEARVRILSNSNGQAAVIELSRPGVEILVQLRPDRIDVVERVGGREFRWLGSATVDLSRYRVVELLKSADVESGSESLRVAVDGQELLLLRPRGGGELDVGRVVMGSLSYSGYGASLWSWVEVELWRAEPVGSSVSTERPSVGSLKARWSGR